MGRRGIRGLKARVGRECCISRGQARSNIGGMQARGVQGGSHIATMRCNSGNHSVTGRDATGGSSRSEGCQEP